GEWLELPTYSTALGIMAFGRLKPEGWKETIEPWVKYLQVAQNKNGGWSPEGNATNLNISATRYALLGLDHAHNVGQNMRFRALKFLNVCQNEDGGFFFSTTMPRLNKAGELNGKSISYGSATVDGLIATSICRY